MTGACVDGVIVASMDATWLSKTESSDTCA